MTEKQYKSLQKWCSLSSNRKQQPEKYKQNVLLRDKATQIRRNIAISKGHIKSAMFVLEACTSQESRVKWLSIVAVYKADKKNWQEQFNNLKYESED